MKCQVTVQWCYTAAMQVSMFTCMAEQRLAEAICGQWLLVCLCAASQNFFALFAFRRARSAEAAFVVGKALLAATEAVLTAGVAAAISKSKKT